MTRALVVVPLVDQIATEGEIAMKLQPIIARNFELILTEKCKLMTFALALVLTLGFMVGASFSAVHAQMVFANDSIVKFGGSLTITADEVVRGDVVVFGGSVDTAGRVEGDIVVFGGSVRVNQFVGGNVLIMGGSIYLGPEATVRGDVTAMGGTIQKSPGAVINGSEWVRDGRWWGFREFRFMPWSYRFGDPLGWRLFVMAGYFVFALAVYSFVPQAVRNVSTAMERSAARSFVLGLFAMIVLVPLSVISAITIIGIPVTIGLIIGFSAAKAFGYVAAVLLIGDRLGRAIKGENGSFTEPINHIGGLIIGVVALGLIGYIPVIGWLASFLVAAFSIGAVLETRFGTNRPWIPSRQTA